MLLIFEIAQMHTDECVREREKEHRNVADNVCVCVLFWCCYYSYVNVHDWVESVCRLLLFVANSLYNNVVGCLNICLCALCR